MYVWVCIRVKVVTQGRLAALLSSNGQLGKPCQFRKITVLFEKITQANGRRTCNSRNDTHAPGIGYL